MIIANKTRELWLTVLFSPSVGSYQISRDHGYRGMTSFWLPLPIFWWWPIVK